MQFRRKFISLGLILIAIGSSASAQTQLPQTVYVWPMSSNYEAFPYASPPAFSQDILMASLAGIVNRSTNGEVLLSPDNGTQPNPRYWLDQLKLSYPQVQSQVQTNPGFYIDKYKPKLTGYVLFDPAIPESVNVATSIAGVTDAIIVSDSKASGFFAKSTKDLAIAKGLTQVADARNMTYAQVYAQYGSQFNKNMLFHQDTYFDFQLRDYAVMNRGFTYFTDPVALNPGPAPTESYAANQNPQGKIYGWANSEFDLFNQSSQNNQQVVGSNHNWSSSTTSKWKVPLQTQKQHAQGSVITKPGKHYVAFVMSDGDNVTWLTNGMGSDPKYFGSPHRGKFNMTWDFSPSLAEMNPTAHNFFYSKANDGTAPGKPGTDTFVAASGAGITFPSQTPDIQGLADSINASMAAADLKVASILDTNYIVSNKLEVILNEPMVSGMMYKTYDDFYKGRAGAITWRNGKPIVGVKYSLWDGADSAQELVGLLNASATDAIDDLASYSIINVHPWSTTGPDGTGTGDPMSNLNYLVDQLTITNKVEIVGLEELMVHLRNHFGTPLPGAIVNATWTRNANSNWGTTRSNWTGALPNFVNATVNFGSAITANRNVSVTVPVTAGTINLDNSFSYNINGTSSITLSTSTGPATINIANGNHTISAPLTYTNDTTIDVSNSGNTLTVSNLQPSTFTLTKSGEGTVALNNVRALGLSIMGGTVKVQANGSASGTSKVAGLAFDTSGRLDITDNDLIVTNMSRAEVEALVKSGFGNYDWQGVGVTSSTAATYAQTNGSRAVGVIDNADWGYGTFGGQTVSGTDILVKYTWTGDANVDGLVDNDDFGQFLYGYNGGGSARWLNGDFDYSGVVDNDDFGAFLVGMNAFNASGGVQLSEEFKSQLADFASVNGVPLVLPEPSFCGIALSGALFLRRRRT